MQCGKLSIKKTNLKISPRSAFHQYIPERTVSTSKIITDIILSGELKIASKDNKRLSPFEAINLLESIKIVYENGVFKVV